MLGLHPQLGEACDPSRATWEAHTPYTSCDPATFGSWLQNLGKEIKKQQTEPPGMWPPRASSDTPQCLSPTAQACGPRDPHTGTRSYSRMAGSGGHAWHLLMVTK